MFTAFEFIFIRKCADKFNTVKNVRTVNIILTLNDLEDFRTGSSRKYLFSMMLQPISGLGFLGLL